MRISDWSSDVCSSDLSPLSGDLAGNEAVRRKQRLLLAGAAGGGLILSSFWIFSGGGDSEKLGEDGVSEVNVSTKDLVNRHLSQPEWMALSEKRFQSTEHQLTSIDRQTRRLERLTDQLLHLRALRRGAREDQEDAVASIAGGVGSTDKQP